MDWRIPVAFGSKRPKTLEWTDLGDRGVVASGIDLCIEPGLFFGEVCCRDFSPPHSTTAIPSIPPCFEGVLAVEGGVECIYAIRRLPRGGEEIGQLRFPSLWIIESEKVEDAVYVGIGAMSPEEKAVIDGQAFEFTGRKAQAGPVDHGP